MRAPAGNHRTIATGIAATLAGAALLLTSPSAHAHPHVTVIAKAVFVLDSKGQITAIRHHWTFDEAYSAFATTGMKRKDGKVIPSELADLAKLNVESLNEFSYFTQLKQGKKAIEFNPPLAGYSLSDTGKALILDFVLPLKHPLPASSNINLRVDDETYFVAFGLDETEPARFEGNTACTLDVKRPPKTTEQSMQKLGEEFFSNLKEGFTDNLATTIRINCPQ